MAARTAVVAEVAVTPVGDPGAVDRMPELRVRRLVAVHTGAPQAEAVAVTAADTGGIHFIAGRPRVGALPVERVVAGIQERTRIPSTLPLETILGRSRPCLRDTRRQR